MPQIIEYINVMFTVVFSVEASIKLIGLGKNFFKEGWNIFGLIIVLASISGILLSAMTGLNFGGATNIIRTIRVFRILRLIKKATNLKIIFNTFIKSLPALFNVWILFFLVLYIYSIVGIYLFAEVKLNGILTETRNF